MAHEWRDTEKPTMATPITERRRTTSRIPVYRPRKTVQASARSLPVNRLLPQQLDSMDQDPEFPNYSIATATGNTGPNFQPRTYENSDWLQTLSPDSSKGTDSIPRLSTDSSAETYTSFSSITEDYDASLSQSDAHDDRLWGIGPDSELESFTSLEYAREKCEEKIPQNPQLDRPYTSTLGIPEPVPRKDGGDSSVVSDAGDQLHKRHKRHPHSEENSGPPSVKQYPTKVNILPQSNVHEFQEELYLSLEDTQNLGSNPREKGFLPKERLDGLVNIDSVARELARHLTPVFGPDHIRRLAEDICKETEVVHHNKRKVKSFRKIFALLVMTEHTSSIQRFLDENVSDLDLPLAVLKGKGGPELRRRDTFNAPSDTPLTCFDHQNWSPFKLQDFEEWQWTMLAPFFSLGSDGDVKHYKLMDKCILPFTSATRDEDGADDDAECLGGFGRVFMVKIHKEHHNFHDPQYNRGFAVKQLFDPSEIEFKKEVTILKKFSGERSHPHVVSLLATYEHCRKFHLIFYRAQGTLLKLWESIMPFPSLNATNIRWMASQCAGIADGLSRLHRHLTMASFPLVDDSIDRTCDSPSRRRVTIIDPVLHNRADDQDRYGNSSLTSPDEAENAAHQVSPAGKAGSKQVEKYGRHGDINPLNVLWFDDATGNEAPMRGTLKIADFGQAEINSLLSKSKKRSVANTLTYRPPECDSQPGIIRQSYDTWCLGCVYLEFIAWMLGGWDLVHKFSKIRLTPDAVLGLKTDTFFYRGRDNGVESADFIVKPQVTQVRISRTYEMPQLITKRQFIDYLHRLNECSDYFHDFLDIIQHDMLIIDSSQRMTCEKIKKRLETMRDTCRKDESYCAEGRPWKASRESLANSAEVTVSPTSEGILTKRKSSLPPYQGLPKSRPSSRSSVKLR